MCRHIDFLQLAPGIACCLAHAQTNCPPVVTTKHPRSQGLHGMAFGQAEEVSIKYTEISNIIGDLS
jgi:hypothetical protein